MLSQPVRPVTPTLFSFEGETTEQLNETNKTTASKSTLTNASVGVIVVVYYSSPNPTEIITHHHPEPGVKTSGVEVQSNVVFTNNQATKHMGFCNQEGKL